MNKRDTETAVELEKLDLRSHEIAADKAAELLRLFPEIRTEGGKIDFDRLKRVLGEIADPGKERYGMNWPGKADCFKTIQQPTLATLRPCPEESSKFDTTENIIIEGDNLEVLKLLQKSYISKIKMIYIDPPYNTGKDFIYPDNYAESLQTYLEYTNQVDDTGKKFSTNSDTDGRFHSKWLNMMYPRLFLARNLLQNNGVIFVSIDENEFDNLKKLLDEVFGEENLVACIANVNNPKGRSDDKYIATAHEYLMIYKKGDLQLGGWAPEEKVTSRYNKVDDKGRRYREIDLRKTGDADRREDRPNMFYYFLYSEKTKELTVSQSSDIPTGFIQIKPIRDDNSDGRWRWGFDSAKAGLENLIAKFMPVRKIWGVFEKDYLSAEETVKPTSAWTMKEVNSERGSEQFIDLGFDKEIFPRPKPVGLLHRILEIGVQFNKGDIALDFFAGSGVLAQAVIEKNLEDGGDRRFILVQLPEPTRTKKADGTWDESPAWKAGFETISDITKERVRRVITKIEKVRAGENSSGKGQQSLIEDDDSKAMKAVDLGFKVFKLDESNFKPWQAEVPTGDTENLVKQLEFHASHLRDERTPVDFLYEILLKSGFPLTTQVEKLTLCGKTVYSIAQGAMLICLDDTLTHELIKTMADRKPERVICLDEGFAGNDQLKTNAVQTMKARGVTSFKTV